MGQACWACRACQACHGSFLIALVPVCETLRGTYIMYLRTYELISEVRATRTVRTTDIPKILLSDDVFSSESHKTVYTA